MMCGLNKSNTIRVNRSTQVTFSTNSLKNINTTISGNYNPKPNKEKWRVLYHKYISPFK